MKIQIVNKAMGKVADLTAPLVMKLSKKAPEIALGTGIAFMVGGTVWACVTTWRKLPDRVAEKDATISNGTDKPAAYSKMAGRVALDYAPSALMIGGGVAMVVWSHNKLRSRLAALGAAYATLESMYTEYRSRVIEDYGEDVDRKFRLGIRDEELTYTKTLKNGKEKDVTEVCEAVHPDGSGYSMYARYFDQFNSNMHVKDQEANFDFLRIQQNIANEKLNRKGYLFLNEVYDSLGFKEVPEGQLVGWVKGMGDSYVDFGLFEARNADARNYIDYNGKETCFVLDFNVDGVMWDLI
jgi:hypothetical protein